MDEDKVGVCVFGVGVCLMGLLVAVGKWGWNDVLGVVLFGVVVLAGLALCIAVVVGWIGLVKRSAELKRAEETKKEVKRMRKKVKVREKSVRRREKALEIEEKEDRTLQRAVRQARHRYESDCRTMREAGLPEDEERMVLVEAERKYLKTLKGLLNDEHSSDGDNNEREEYGEGSRCDSGA